MGPDGDLPVSSVRAVRPALLDVLLEIGVLVVRGPADKHARHAPLRVQLGPESLPGTPRTHRCAEHLTEVGVALLGLAVRVEGGQAPVASKGPRAHLEPKDLAVYTDPA